MYGLSNGMIANVLEWVWSNICCLKPLWLISITHR